MVLEPFGGVGHGLLALIVERLRQTLEEAQILRPHGGVIVVAFQPIDDVREPISVFILRSVRKEPYE